MTVFQIGHCFSNRSRFFKLGHGFSNWITVFQIGSRFFKSGHGFSNWVTVFQIGSGFFKSGHRFSNGSGFIKVGHSFIKVGHGLSKRVMVFWVRVFQVLGPWTQSWLWILPTKSTSRNKKLILLIDIDYPNKVRIPAIYYISVS